MKFGLNSLPPFNNKAMYRQLCRQEFQSSGMPLGKLFLTFQRIVIPVKLNNSVNFRLTHAQYVDLANHTTEKQSYKYLTYLITPSLQRVHTAVHLYCHSTIKWGVKYHSFMYEGYLESKERFAIQRYLLIIGKKQNMQVL